MNINDIAKKCFVFIEHYENYLQNERLNEKNVLVEEYTKDMNSDEKEKFYEVYKSVHLLFEPWKMLPRENLQESLNKSFNDDSDKLYDYKGFIEILNSLYIYSTAEELERKYKEKGLEISLDDIFDEVYELSKEQLIKDNFSLSLINLHDLYKEAEQLKIDICEVLDNIHGNENEEMEEE